MLSTWYFKRKKKKLRGEKKKENKLRKFKLDDEMNKNLLMRAWKNSLWS